MVMVLQCAANLYMHCINYVQLHIALLKFSFCLTITVFPTLAISEYDEKLANEVKKLECDGNF